MDAFADETTVYTALPRLDKTVSKFPVADSVDFVATSVHNADTDKTKQSCVVRFGGMN